MYIYNAEAIQSRVFFSSGKSSGRASPVVDTKGKFKRPVSDTEGRFGSLSHKADKKVITYCLLSYSPIDALLLHAPAISWKRTRAKPRYIK